MVFRQRSALSRNGMLPHRGSKPPPAHLFRHDVHNVKEHSIRRPKIQKSEPKIRPGFPGPRRFHLSPNSLFSNSTPAPKTQPTRPRGDPRKPCHKPFMLTLRPTGDTLSGISPTPRSSGRQPSTSVPTMSASPAKGGGPYWLPSSPSSPFFR